MPEDKTYTKYTAFADIVLKAALDEHKLYLVDLDNAQIGIPKQYLWLSALLVGAIASVISYDMPKLSTMTTLSAIYWAGLTAAAGSSVYAFIRSIQLLSGVRMDSTTYHYNVQLCDAYGDDTTTNAIIARNNWVTTISDIIMKAREDYNRRTAQTRSINRSIVFSACLASASAGLLLLSHLLQT